MTLEEKPDDDSTHWTTRRLAERFGIGKDSAARIWRDHKIKPWMVSRCEISNDPELERSWSMSSVCT